MKNSTDFIVFKLAIADLWHEWILTLCMILAMAAIIAPLLILLGLKQGTVETLRQRLMENPVNREIIPTNTLNLSPHWFDKIQKREDVDFVLPTVMSSFSQATFQSSTQIKPLDVIPTAPNDPLLLENQGNIPKPGECTLTYSASEELNTKAGEYLTVIVKRGQYGLHESVNLPCQVNSILNPRADNLARVYMPFDFVLDMENYREGFAVPKRGWKGQNPIPYFSYDGIWLLVPHKLNSLEQIKLTINTGFSEINRLNVEYIQEQLGFRLPENFVAYELNVVGETVQTSNIEQLKKNRLRGKNAIILPYIKFDLLITKSGDTFPVIGLSLSTKQLKHLNLPSLPWQSQKGSYLKIMLPERSPTTSLFLSAKSANKKLNFSLEVVGKSFSKHAIVPIELLGILRTGQTRPIYFDKTQNLFLLQRVNFHGFRLYANSIDDIPQLYRWFVSQNIEVATQIQAIEKLRVLDTGLTRLFWIIAIVAILGGISALVASMYAAVERKKQALGLLRLMGVTKYQVFWFPIYQGLIIISFSLVIGLVIFWIFAMIGNMVFSFDVSANELICQLPFETILVILMVTLGLAWISTLFSAWKVTLIEPAEAIRVE